jgi:hypothetical protein
MSDAAKKLKRMAKESERIIRDNPRDYAFIVPEVVEGIKKRTKLSKGVDANDKPLKKLLPLQSEKYKAIRKKNKSRLSKDTTPARSNATATGQMLDSITGSQNGTKFSFEFKGSRKPDITGRDSGLTNSEVAKYYQEKRPFFYLSKPEKNNLIRKIRDVITKRIKNLFDA